MLRSIVALFSLLFLISLCTAKTAIVDGIEWTYTVSNGEASIGHGAPNVSVKTAIPTSTIGHLVIPSTLGGYPVTRIGMYAFQGCSGLTGDLVIPEGVTTIEDCAFTYCSGLTGNLVIPEGVRTIGHYAFSGCRGLTGNLVIPESMTSIGEWAFNGCSGLTGNLVIPKGVATIEESAFDGCSGLTGNLVIPEGVRTIGNYAFNCCRGLTGNLVIPEGVTTIGDWAFNGCRGLTGNLVIPEGVRTIGYYAFSGCSGLTGNLVIPEGVTTIGESAFYCTPFKTAIFLGPPPKGWDTADLLSIVSFSKEYARQWNQVLSSAQRGPLLETISTAGVTVSTETTTPKTMSVTYTIHSEVKQMAKVYVLAFEDGVRSFAKVVPVKTATADSPSSIPNGREVATNTPHTFIWNVPADWDTDLSKVMVEILVQEGELLPLELITIPGDATTPTMTITRNALPQNELFNALLWCYASGDTSLTNTNGVLKVNGTQIANGSSLSSTGAQATALLNYLYGKMGYKVLSGDDLTYAEEMTEIEFSSSGLTQVAVKLATTSASEE